MKHLFSFLVLLIFSYLDFYAQCWQSISCGAGHTLAIKTDGTLWAWGLNDNGQLGLNDNVDRTYPVQVGKDNTWKQVSAGFSHSSAVKEDGTLWTWGDNASWQLGLGQTSNKLVPTQVVSIQEWLYTEAAYNVTYAITKQGVLKMAGSKIILGNYYSSWDYFNPHSNRSADSNWLLVEGCTQSAVGLKKDGSIWTWGNNSYGQLANGNLDNTNPYFDYTRVGTGNDWKSIAASYTHVMALKNDGTLWTWGDTSFGRLGIGYKDNPGLRPLQVGTDNDWKAISCGGSTSYAIKNDGSLWAWGNNLYGSYGNGQYSHSYVPIKIGSNNDWKLLSGGRRHVVHLNTSNELKACGNNATGQLGDSSQLDKGSFNPPIVCRPSVVKTTRLQFQNNFTIYPNPLHSHQFSINIKGYNTYQLYNSVGQIILSGTLNDGINTIELPANTLPGIYSIKIGESAYQLIITP